MTQTPQEWQAQWSARFAENLRNIRKEQGFKSARELSEACEAVGYPIPRNAIANIESGRKTAIPVHELLVLARALRVPPTRLLLDVATREAVEVLPGVQADPWAALQWFAGEAPLRTSYEHGPRGDEGLTDRDRRAFEAGAGPITWNRIHDQMVKSIVADRHASMKMLGWAAVESAGSPLREGNVKLAWDRWQRMVDGQDDLRQWRRRMADAGVSPPEVDDDILGREPADHEWPHRTEMERAKVDAILEALIDAQPRDGDGGSDG